jgi:hypothetical protein
MMAVMLTRRELLGLVPGAAAVALVPSAALSPIPTPADFEAAWQKIAEALWTGRIPQDYLIPYKGQSMVSGALQSMWGNPAGLGPLHTAERNAVGKLIATGQFWPLSADLAT